MIAVDSQAIEWLLEPKEPSVRFIALKTFAGLPADPQILADAQKAVMADGPVPAILKKQNADGSWSDPARFYLDKYKGTVWTLLLLAELAADPEDPGVRKACEFVLGHAWEPENGGFSYMQSAKTQTGLPSGVIPCLTGNMVYSLIKLGFLDDSRVQKAIEWIVRYQRADDAECKAPKGGIYDRLYTCFGKHSCHMGVAKSFKALAAIPAEKRTAAVKAKIDELSEYFLKHHLFKKSHNLAEISKPGWLKLGFPLMYQTDILELLEIFSDLKINDPRLEDAIGILRNKRQPDGCWLLENSFNGKMQVSIEKKGAPSKWITLKALKILQTYGIEQGAGDIHGVSNLI